jgi:hypothetical protein
MRTGVRRRRWIFTELPQLAIGVGVGYRFPPVSSGGVPVFDGMRRVLAALLEKFEVIYGS